MPSVLSWLIPGPGESGQHPAPAQIIIHRGQRGDLEKWEQVILTILTTAYCSSEMRKFTQGFHVTRDHVSAPGPCEIRFRFLASQQERIEHCKYGPRRPPTEPHNGTVGSRKSHISDGMRFEPCSFCDWLDWSWQTINFVL